MLTSHKRWKTPRGSRWRALQKAEPVNDSPLLWGRSFSGGVLVEDLENEQMDRFGGSDHSFLPGVVSSRQTALMASLSRRKEEPHTFSRLQLP